MDLVYPLSVYFAYFVLGKSPLFARPRVWARRVLPGWLTYPLGCVVCFTWWVGVLITAAALVSTGWLMLSPVHLLVAPVVNLLLDETLGALERVNTPVYSMEPKGAVTVNSIAAQRPGEMTMVSATSDVRAGENSIAFDWRPRSMVRWAMGAEWPYPTDVGRRVKVTAERAYGPAGEGLIAGRTGTIARVGPVTCAWAYWITPDGGGQAFSANPGDCTFLDEPPFNPLDHEQTR